MKHLFVEYWSAIKEECSEEKDLVFYAFLMGITPFALIARLYYLVYIA